jgi:hypothetical protein
MWSDPFGADSKKVCKKPLFVTCNREKTLRVGALRVNPNQPRAARALGAATKK